MEKSLIKIKKMVLVKSMMERNQKKVRKPKGKKYLKKTK